MSQAKTQFLWSWDEGPPRPDSRMTRQRAARLLISWRTQAKAPWLVCGRRFKCVKLFRHIGNWRQYQVSLVDGLKGSLWIGPPI